MTAHTDASGTISFDGETMTTGSTLDLFNKEDGIIILGGQRFVERRKCGCTIMMMGRQPMYMPCEDHEPDVQVIVYGKEKKDEKPDVGPNTTLDPNGPSIG